MNASGEDPPPREANALLRRARELRGWSRERLVSELQQRFPGVAVTPKDVARWERGKRRPGPYYREKLCAIFEMTADQLGLIAPMPVPALGPAPPPALAPPPAPAGSLTSVPLLTISLVRSEVESGDPAIWLGIRLAQIIYRIGTWRGHALDCEEVQTLIDQELAMIDETLQSSTTQQALQLSRREALVTIAALPTVLLSWRRPDWSGETLAEEFLPQCAASLAACWHLLKGDGLTAVREVLPRFAPTLTQLALHPSRYQRVAARLATQANILQAILAMHRLDTAGREKYCHEAIRCSRAAADASLTCAALMYLGYTYSFCYRPRRPRQAIQAFEEALRVLGEKDSLLRSDVAMGLAEAYAQCGDERNALLSLQMAQDAFPVSPELDPSFTYAECGLNVLYQWEGKMYLELSQFYPDSGYQRRGWEAVTRSIDLPSVSERSTNETLTYQADAARLMGELDLFVRYVRQSVEMALALSSQKRYNEVLEVYQRIPPAWRRERQIQTLSREFFAISPLSCGTKG